MLKAEVISQAQVQVLATNYKEEIREIAGNSWILISISHMSIGKFTI